MHAVSRSLIWSDCCADEELAEKLKDGSEDLASYILMQRIKPTENSSVLVRRGKHSAEPTLSELGVYGVYLQVKDEVVINECVGHLLRTKTATSNEGGVAAGFAVLDSPYLVWGDVNVYVAMLCKSSLVWHVIVTKARP
jgi:hypothetical protein